MISCLRIPNGEGKHSQRALSHVNQPRVAEVKHVSCYATSLVVSFSIDFAFLHVYEPF